MRTYQTFSEFWPFYLQQHAKPGTRAFHYVGTTLVVLIIGVSIVTLNAWLLLLFPVAGYFFAWISHALIERNKPATFTYPLWSLLADFKMWGLWLVGRLGPELERASIADVKSKEPAV